MKFNARVFILVASFSISHVGVAFGAGSLSKDDLEVLPLTLAQDVVSEVAGAICPGAPHKQKHEVTVELSRRTLIDLLVAIARAEPVLDPNTDYDCHCIEHQRNPYYYENVPAFSKDNSDLLPLTLAQDVVNAMARAICDGAPHRQEVTVMLYRHILQKMLIATAIAEPVRNPNPDTYYDCHCHFVGHYHRHAACDGKQN